MSKGFKVCKECGKEYKACHTINTKNLLRWQDVACSPECGSKYFARILESRSKQNIAKTNHAIAVFEEDEEIEEVYEIDEEQSEEE